MKTAIDNYELGKLREINADCFKESISSKTNRFRCTECGEIVSLVVRKRGEKFFAHKSGKKEECELRVDGGSGLTVYDRIGLSLYLRKNKEGNFYFSILFRKVPANEFFTCKDRNPYIEIYDFKNYKKKERFYLNGDKFVSDKSNFIEISYLPKLSSKLYIKYSDNYTKLSFKKYWSDYINCPLPLYGSLFSAEENEGKIVRPWENISTYTEYYWVKKSRELSPYNEIEMKEVGNVFLKNQVYYVFKISINVSTENRIRYMSIAKYLEENLKVILLEKKSNIYPLWPPCIKSNEGYDAIRKTKLYSNVLSTNKNPEVYSYRKNLQNTTKLIVDNIGTKNMVLVDVTDEEILINVDRKVTSTGIIIRKNELPYVKEDRILINLENGDSIKGKIELNDTRDITIESLCDINLIKVGNDGKVEEFDKKNNFKIKDVKFGDRYFLLSNINKIAEITIKEKIINNKIFDEKQLLRTIKKSIGTNLIAISKDVRKTITCSLKYLKNKETRTLLRKYLLENRVPLRVYMILRGGR